MPPKKGGRLQKFALLANFLSVMGDGNAPIPALSVAKQLRPAEEILQ
jgi:hypothetical protein